LLNNKAHEIDYLELLSNDYPSIQAVCTEIINLQAILNLPKGTEHFMSDLHGEYEAFLHILKNASGVIKTKIDILYKTTLTEHERKLLATLIYYPEQKLYHLRQSNKLNDEWYALTLYRLVEICRMVSTKYTRSKVRKAMPQDFSYIIEELLHTRNVEEDKHDYYTQIINSIIDIGRADEFIVAIANLIKRLTVDHLHILGDIFDRGPRADIIMDELLKYHSIDFQWGNHDIEWIGAASGHTACIANVIRNSLRYNNFDVIEIGYGINTRTLANFAMSVYGNDECERFIPLDSHKHAITTNDARLTAKMHKAIAVIQFKLEGQIVKNHPEYEMDDRNLLDKIDFDNGCINICGKEYPLADFNLPTVDPKSPFELTEEEKVVVASLKRSFLHSEKLQQHIRFVLNNGGIYKVYNGNLLFHGCIPLDENGNLDSVNFFGEKMKGKTYLDFIDNLVRKIYLSKCTVPESDFVWYLWCGKKSPLHGKDRLTTFERYFTDSKELLDEPKNHYYAFIESTDTCDMIFEEFGLDKCSAHIINGHVPVRTGKGESPIKAEGKLYVIDGGFSKPYQGTTGIAGYTLINNSTGFYITQHQPFTGVNDVIENDFDLYSSRTLVEQNIGRKKVRDTDIGEGIKHKIKILNELLDNYKKGYITERVK